MTEFTRKVKIVKDVPCEIAFFQKWCKPVTSKELRKLPCSACHNSIGDKRWAIAWRKEKTTKRPMRLCEECGIKAEKVAKDVLS